MANHFETETSSGKHLSFLEQLALKIKQLAKIEEAAPDQGARDRVHQENRDQLKGDIRAHRQSLEADDQAKAAEQHESEMFANRITGANPAERAVAQEAIKNQAYTKEQLDAARESVSVVRSMVREGDAVPAWLNVDALTDQSVAANPALGVYAVTLSLYTPEYLADHPEVIYRETSRLYYSTKWTSLSADAFEQTHNTIQTALANAGDRLNSTKEEFYQRVDRRPNLYRTERLEPVEPPAGGPPRSPGRGGQPGSINTKSDEFAAWARERYAYAQNQELDKMMRFYQEQLDRAARVSLESQREVLNEWLTELERGSHQSSEVVDLDYNVKYHVPTKLNIEESQQYMDHLRVLKEAYNAEINKLREEQMAAKQNAEMKARYPGMIDWKMVEGSDLPDVIKNRAEHPKDPFYLHFWDQAEVEKMIAEGQLGQRKMISEFIESVYGAGRERARPDLPDQQKFQEFEKIMEFIYGDKATGYLSEYKFLWNDFGKQDWVLKVLAYQPADIKDKLNAIRQQLGADLDRYGRVEFADITIRAYYNAIDSMQANKSIAYHEALKFLGSDGRSLIDLQGNLLNIPAGIQGLDYSKPITHDQLYLHLQKLNKQGLLDPEQKRYFYEIDRRVFTAAMGTGITDADVLIYSEADIQNNIFAQRREELQQELAKMRSQGRTQGEIAMAETQLDRLDQLIKAQHNKLIGIKNFQASILEMQPDSPEAVALMHGYSPLEWEVRRRILPLIEKEFNEKYPGKVFNPTEHEWIVRDAIRAGRMHAITTGHLATAASYEVTRPQDKAWMFESIKTYAGESVMIAPFMEDIVRVINPEYFAHRFGMGEGFGDKVRGMIRFYNMENGGFLPKDFKLTETDQWQRLKHVVHDEQERMQIALAEIYEEELGISFSELVGGGLFQIAGPTDETMWRNVLAIWEEQKRSFLRDNPGATVMEFENRSLGIQLAMHGMEKPEDITARMRILDKMMQRTPTAFINKISGRVISQMRDANGISRVEFDEFQRALDMAESRVVLERQYLGRENLDMSAESDFNDLVLPFLDKMGVFNGMSDADRLNKASSFRNFLVDLGKHVRHDRVNEQGHIYGSIIEAWAHKRFPMTMTLADVDWSNTDFFKLSSAALDRRGRDMMSAAAARDIMFDILFKPDFLSPEDPMETIKKLQELKLAVMAYAHPSVAEDVTKKVTMVWIDFNRHRGLQNPIGWIPGVDSLLSKAGEFEYEHAIDWMNSPFGRAIGFGKVYDRWQKFLGSNGLMAKKMKHWPHSLAEAVSLSHRYFGPEGNHWDEHRIDFILDQIQRKGIFTFDAHAVNDLRRKFKSTMGWRVVGVARKYWWVMPAATIAVAAAQSRDEEERGHH